MNGLIKMLSLLQVLDPATGIITTAIICGHWVPGATTTHGRMNSELFQHLRVAFPRLRSSKRVSDWPEYHIGGQDFNL